MTFSHHKIELQTQNPLDLIDITDSVQDFVTNSGKQNGMLNIMCQHTTATVNINESCDALKQDYLATLERLVPSKLDYEHNKVAVDDRANAHSHLLNFFMNTTPTIPIIDGQLQLGTWQRIFFIELDGPRKSRSVLLTIISSPL